MFSYWEQTAFFNHIDLAIIGSGIVGLNAAITYREIYPERKVVIFERGTLPSGASTKNAGFACFGSASELLDDIQQNGASPTWDLVEQRWRGLQRLRTRVGDKNLQFQELGGYELFRDDEQRSYENCRVHLPDFNQQLARITGRENVFRPADSNIQHFGFQGVEHLIHNTAEGQIHTGRMMQTLINIARSLGIEIYNGFAINGFHRSKNGVALRNERYGNVSARLVLVATNGFAQQFFPNLSVQPARNQVLITEPIRNLRIRGTFHYQEGYFYFRNIDNRILLGGGRHLNRTGETTTEFGTTSLIQSALKNLLANVILPHQPVTIARWWSGILGVGTAKQPIVAEVAPGVFVAVRLGGMGVAIGSLIGEKAGYLVAER